MAEVHQRPLMERLRGFLYILDNLVEGTPAPPSIPLDLPQDIVH